MQTKLFLKKKRHLQNFMKNVTCEKGLKTTKYYRYSTFFLDTDIHEHLHTKNRLLK